MQARLSCISPPPTVVYCYVVRSHRGNQIAVQINIAAVDDSIFRVRRMWEINAINASVIQAEILSLDDCAEHLLFDGSHDVNC